MIQTDGRTKLRNEILKMASGVPKTGYQGWGQQTAAAYKKLCGDAQRLAIKSAATEQQLSGKLGELRAYWAKDAQGVVA